MKVEWNERTQLLQCMQGPGTLSDDLDWAWNFPIKGFCFFSRQLLFTIKPFFYTSHLVRRYKKLDFQVIVVLNLE